MRPATPQELGRWDELVVANPDGGTPEGLALHPSERELIRRLLAFPARCARRPTAARRTAWPPTRWS